MDSSMKLLSSIGSVLTGLDYGRLSENHGTTDENRQGVLNRYMEKTSSFYVLLDDVDTLCSAYRKDYYDVIWGEILALLTISQRMNGVFPIVSVRRDIWYGMTFNSGNRDKMDHVRSMVYYLTPSRIELKAILEHRLEYCKEQNGLTGDDCYKPFFLGTSCKIPKSNERRSWADYLSQSSRENPRDIVQLVGELIQNAIRKGNDQITEQDVEDVSLQYSEERFSDLVDQNKVIFPHIEAVIRSFSKKNFELNVEEMLKHLQSVLGVADISIVGKRNLSDEEKVFCVWDYLFNIGFLGARTNDNTQDRGFSFIKYDKTLVSKERWGDMQKYTWHIYPCYRTFLLQVKEEDSRRVFSTEQKEEMQKNRKRKRRGRR